MANKESYGAPAFCIPSIEKLSEISRRLGIDADENEITHYRNKISQMEKSWRVIENMPERTLPVKYPRTPGHRPHPQENKYNAWYWKTEIPGASSGRLFGKRVVLKDTICLAGVPMMNGSRVMEGYVPEFDATVVTKVLDEGGVIVGKAACESLCCSGSSFTSDKGPVLNPIDVTRVAGGSSSGCAVLVASGDADMAIGGDQGGSIRIPACFCGIVGMKPTYGLIPYTGALAIFHAIDYLGPMARTVYDCALLLEVIAGYDNGLDIRQPSNLEIPKYTEKLTGKVDGMKIGIVKEGFVNAKDGVDRIVKDAVFRFAECGANVEEMNLPVMDLANPVITSIFIKGVHGAIAGINNDRGFQPTSLNDALSHGMRTKMKDASPTTKMACILGEYMQENYGSHFSSKATNLMHHIRESVDEALKDYDVLVMPTILSKPPKLPPADVDTTGVITEAFAHLGNTALANISGHPAVTINAGYCADGLPVGMMIMGRHFEDDVTLNVAYVYEMMRDRK